jgi:hypothetical protein
LKPCPLVKDSYQIKNWHWLCKDNNLVIFPVSQGCIVPGLFFTSWGSSPALNFGEKLHGIFAKVLNFALSWKCKYAINFDRGGYYPFNWKPIWCSAIYLSWIMSNTNTAVFCTKLFWISKSNLGHNIIV